MRDTTGLLILLAIGFAPFAVLAILGVYVQSWRRRCPRCRQRGLRWKSSIYVRHVERGNRWRFSALDYDCLQCGSRLRLFIGCLGMPLKWEIATGDKWTDMVLLKLCERCSYDLTGNVSGVCPECGTPIRRYVPPFPDPGPEPW